MRNEGADDRAIVNAMTHSWVAVAAWLGALVFTLMFCGSIVFGGFPEPRTESAWHLNDHGAQIAVSREVWTVQWMLSRLGIAGFVVMLLGALVIGLARSGRYTWYLRARSYRAVVAAIVSTGVVCFIGSVVIGGLWTR